MEKVTMISDDKLNAGNTGALKKRFVRYGEGSTRYQMGLGMFQRLAAQANAIYRIEGMPALVNVDRFERFLAGAAK